MNKKGDTQKTLFFIFSLLIAVIIISSSSYYLKDYFNGLEFKKEFIVKDLGLSIDTLTFSPNNIEMKYKSSQEIIIESKNSRLNVKLKDLEISREYNFISNIDDFSKRTDELTIKKEGKIKIS